MFTFAGSKSESRAKIFRKQIFDVIPYILYVSNTKPFTVTKKDFE